MPTEIDTLKSKVAKQRAEIARLEQFCARLIREKNEMAADIVNLRVEYEAERIKNSIAELKLRGEWK